MSIKRHKLFRGMGTNAKGRLYIQLVGPQGCGKSLVAKFLKATLPLLGLAEVSITEEQTVI